MTLEQVKAYWEYKPNTKFKRPAMDGWLHVVDGEARWCRSGCRYQPPGISAGHRELSVGHIEWSQFTLDDAKADDWICV